MKNYIVKNYKGNIVESLERFSKKYPNFKICEAVENENTLKIKIKESIDKFNELIKPVKTVLHNCDFSNCFKYGEAFFEMCDYSMDPIDWDLYKDADKKSIDEDIIENDMFFLYVDPNIPVVSNGKYIPDNSEILFFGDETECIIYAAFCPDINDEYLKKIDVKSGRYSYIADAIKQIRELNFSHGDKKDNSFYRKAKEILNKSNT